MDIKRRLFISNAITFIVPLLTTIIVGFVYIFFVSGLNNNFSYENFKKILEVKSEIEAVKNEAVAQQDKEIEESRFHSYLKQKLNRIDGEVLIFKKDDVIFSSREYEMIDINKLLLKARMNESMVDLDIEGKEYRFNQISLRFKDGSLGYAVILTPSFEGIGVFEKFVLLLAVVFFTTYIAVNILMSYEFTKRIINPISQLKKATTEISKGDLNFEIVEDGDKEIKELCADFENMRIQLKDSINMKVKYDENRTILVSSISHDLKTPITSIKGYVMGILDGVANTPEKVERYLKTIYSKSEQVDTMIDDLLLYSKLDLKQLPFNFDRTDIVEYFGYCIQETALELEKYGIEIKLETDLGEERYVSVDRERLMRVILNIIDNSRKYMNKATGEIKIKLRETGSSIIVEIRDNGAGVKKEEAGKIFDRFYRADAARSEAKGSGLGLAIAKQIIEGHGGRIWAVSHEEEGMSIMISLAKAA